MRCKRKSRPAVMPADPLQDGSRRDISRAQSGGEAKEQGRQESQGGGKTEDTPVRGHVEKNGVIRRADEGDERLASAA